MKVLVAYASRHGATKGIAERIAGTLERSGLEVTLAPAADVRNVDAYNAFVVGGAAYMGHWLKETAAFVERHSGALGGHPTWLFSSGPVGSELVDAKGRDVVKSSEPEEFGTLGPKVAPRGMKVFFGAYDPDAPAATAMERFGSIFTRMPAIRKAIPSGDFRDWAEIEGWATEIATELQVGRPA